MDAKFSGSMAEAAEGITLALLLGQGKTWEPASFLLADMRWKTLQVEDAYAGHWAPSNPHTFLLGAGAEKLLFLQKQRFPAEQVNIAKPPVGACRCRGCLHSRRSTTCRAELRQWLAIGVGTIPTLATLFREFVGRSQKRLFSSRFGIVKQDSRAGTSQHLLQKSFVREGTICAITSENVHIHALLHVSRNSWYTGANIKYTV